MLFTLHSPYSRPTACNYKKKYLIRKFSLLLNLHSIFSPFPPLCFFIKYLPTRDLIQPSYTSNTHDLALARALKARTMTVSYEQARESARARAEPGWTFGTFCLDDRHIVENDEFYVFNIGARECLIDEDDEYAIYGGVTIVYKEDGKISALSSADVAIDPTVRIKPNPNPTVVI